MADKNKIKSAVVETMLEKELDNEPRSIHAIKAHSRRESSLFPCLLERGHGWRNVYVDRVIA